MYLKILIIKPLLDIKGDYELIINSLRGVLKGSEVGLKGVEELEFVFNYFKTKAEKNKKFDSAFIKYARNVYIYNDIRAKIKHNINVLAGSKIIEEKSYSRY